MTVTGAESYTVRYTHDLNNRLLTEERTGQLNRISVYTHDINGNQLTRTVENETVVQTCPITGGEISATNWQTETYAYNVFNQLIRVDRPGVSAAYTYRADGLRLTKNVNGATTTHVWLRGSIVLELNAAGNVSNWFVRSSAGQLIRSQHYGWYIINARGDVVQRVSNSGAITRAYHFSAFGMELTPDLSDTNPFRFAGEYWDAETQTYYLRARNFNPRTGRFTQPDPHWDIRTNAISGDSPTLRNDRYMPSVHAIMQAGNLYIYSINNPVIWIDPSGRFVVNVSSLAIAGPGSTKPMPTKCPDSGIRGGGSVGLKVPPPPKRNTAGQPQAQNQQTQAQTQPQTNQTQAQSRVQSQTQIRTNNPSAQTKQETVVTRSHSQAPPQSTPNSIHEQLNPDGTVRNRTFFDGNGRPFEKQHFDHPHFNRVTRQYHQPHFHTRMFDQSGRPITPEMTGPLQPGYWNTPTAFQ